MTRMLVIPALALLALGAFVTFATTATTSSSLRYTATSTGRELNSSSTQAASVIPEEPVFVVTHQVTPVPMRGLYMTSCVAATPSWRAKLVKMIEETELNAVVIDIKDYTGTLSFPLDSQEFVQNTNGCFVKDMKEFIGTLHEKHIYVIGRVQVFQDKTYTKSHPEYAVKKKDGTVWKDYKGISFIDVGARPYWEHIARLAISSYEIGFDEINFDYIRYPSDGDMKNIWFSQTGSSTKPVMLETFFKDLRERIPAGQPVISADLFGMTTTNTDDLNIGQVLERTLPHFDYVAPMVYPSHFPPQFNGWKNPNLVPGEVISYSMGKAVLRARALEEKESGFVASTSTPKFIPTDKYTKKLRPWIEDFDCCAPTTHHYTEADVRAQIEATYKVGLTDWVLWDPANHYTPSALKSTE